MKLTADHARALEDILRWRRDMRHFRPDPLSEDHMERLRAAMDMAPSVGNARPWRVIRVRDTGLRARVRAEFERCNAAAAAEYDNETRANYARLKLAGLDVAPEHLAIFTETEPPEGRGLGRRTMPQTLQQSTAMAIYTLWLTARVDNLGVGMVSILDPQRIERIFDAPASWSFTAYLCIGLPAFEDDTPLLHRAGWQENTPTRWEER
ncbi:5,6-dimethylbenzimidazole synthase [Actibacterium sp. MT2.3-13A]|uniref:5,6-dimethylbenzimidazole synthase n=1 Tax=Actibacterium sp. MT2.3-13A TaxID=2828332 RepID=UPI001BAD3612|nr:5,6-dimethylbenzimidazole synthase [Actibacterium sp. MT2.3-13A]